MRSKTCPGDSWFLRRILRQIIRDHREVVMMGRVIQKQPLYVRFSWWYRFSRQDTRKVLGLLAKSMPGIRFSNRGLRIPKEYLSEIGDGGGLRGVGA